MHPHPYSGNSQCIMLVSRASMGVLVAVRMCSVFASLGASGLPKRFEQFKLLFILCQLATDKGYYFRTSVLAVLRAIFPKTR